MTSTLAGQSDLEAMESLRGKLRLEQAELAKSSASTPPRSTVGVRVSRAPERSIAAGWSSSRKSLSC